MTSVHGVAEPSSRASGLAGGGEACGAWRAACSCCTAWSTADRPASATAGSSEPSDRRVGVGWKATQPSPASRTSGHPVAVSAVSPTAVWELLTAV